MKTITATLTDYLSREQNTESCDLYYLKLKNGSHYCLTNADVNVEWGGHVWEHNLLLLKRDQINLKGAPTVDTLSVTIYCDDNDKLEGAPFIAACHNGAMDQASLALYKAYFRSAGTMVDGNIKLQNECIGAYEVFEGNVEIASAGGLEVKLSVKSNIQGLAQQVPVRIFAPQTAYASNEQGVVTSSSTDVATALIPLKPSSRVLINV